MEIRTYQQPDVFKGTSLSKAPLSIAQTAKLDPHAMSAEYLARAEHAKESYHTGMESARALARVGRLEGKKLQAIGQVVDQTANTFNNIAQTKAAIEAENSFYADLTAEEDKIRQSGEYKDADQTIASKAKELAQKHGFGLWGEYGNRFYRMANLAAVRAETSARKWSRNSLIKDTELALQEKEKRLLNQFLTASPGYRDIILDQYKRELKSHEGIGLFTKQQRTALEQAFATKLTALEVEKQIEALDGGPEPVEELTELKARINDSDAFPALGAGMRIKLGKSLDRRIKAAKARMEDQAETNALGILQQEFGDQYDEMALKANDARWLKKNGLDLAAGGKLNARISALAAASDRKERRLREAQDNGINADLSKLYQDGKFGEARSLLNRTTGISASVRNSWDSILTRKNRDGLKVRGQIAGGLVIEQMQAGKLDWTTESLMATGVEPGDIDSLLKTQSSLKTKAETARQKGMPNQLSQYKAAFKSIFDDSNPRKRDRNFNAGWPKAERRFLARLKAEGLDVYDPKASQIWEAMLGEVEVNVIDQWRDYEGPVVGMDVTDEDLSGVDPETVRDVHYYLIRAGKENKQHPKRMAAVAIEQLRKSGRPVTPENIDWVLRERAIEIDRLVGRRPW